MKTVPFFWAPFCIFLTLGGFGDTLPNSTQKPHTSSPSRQFQTKSNKNDNDTFTSSLFTSTTLYPTQSTRFLAHTRSPLKTSLATSGSSPTSSTAVGTNRVKRGHKRGYSTGIAYNRIDDSGPRRGPPRHGHEADNKSPIGEDQTNTDDFKSYGVGYEHRHSDHCEESKCGYNIRHCPHGCVFNSFTCGEGAAYDTCCC